MGEYVIQGFIDRSEYTKPKKVNILDFKTGNLTTKKRYYKGKDFGQTILYARAKELQGFEIGDVGVLLLGRKGNGAQHGKLRLSGEMAYLENVYTEETVEYTLNAINEVAKEISQYYKVYKKIVG
jgi:RecB family exonuclease